MLYRGTTINAFSGLVAQPPDPLLKVMASYGADTRAEKIDLGVGVFRNEQGKTPVLRAVKRAESLLVDFQPSKSYLGAAGNTAFVENLQPLIFGAAFRYPITGLQTPGGTGALRLAAGLIRLGNRQTTIWVSDPTWPNYMPVFEAEGLTIRKHRFFDQTTQSILFDDMMADLELAEPGDCVVLQAGCHNPTGAEFSTLQWDIIAGFLRERDLTPIIDFAYHGFGDDLEVDTISTRLLFDRLPRAILAYSCDKNFALYRERVGAIWVKSADEDEVQAIRSNLLQLARAGWSMPPDHGAAVVNTILMDPELTALWRSELRDQQARIARVRRQLADTHPKLKALNSQKGMFSLLPISPASVTALMEIDAIYTVGSGRINVAGINASVLERFQAALCKYL